MMTIITIHFNVGVDNISPFFTSMASVASIYKKLYILTTKDKCNILLEACIKDGKANMTIS